MGLVASSKCLLACLAASLFVGHVARADCECGYSISLDTHNGETHVFTDLLESDFVHLDITDVDAYGEFGWAAQVFNKTKDAARGPYGEMYSVDTIIPNTIADQTVFTGPGSVGADAGLRLVVDSEIHSGMVGNAEVATVDLHYFYGTYRAGLKVTNVPGTCSAFFWYFNDTQEIDVEFLSAQFRPENNSYPVNLVLQSQESNANGNDASGTQTFKKLYLPFDPTADFHEYRFDFLEDKVLFYADGQTLAEMNGTAVPTSPGHLLVSHWSNGNPGWSQGPPQTDATTTVRYVKAYYNSSLEARREGFTARCVDATLQGAVCGVPDYEPTYFFSYDKNKTPNQTVYSGNGDDENGGDRNGVSQIEATYSSLLFAASLVLAGWISRL